MKSTYTPRASWMTATTVLAAVLLGAVLASGPARAASIGPDYLYKVRDTNIAANCIGSHSTYLGRVGLNPYFAYGNTDFNTTTGNALVVETYEELAFKSAYKYLSCVNGDFDFVYDGAQPVERKVAVIWDCYGDSCFGPINHYYGWSNGWS
jgi:hypothetical protein